MDENEEIDTGMNINAITKTLVAVAELVSVIYFALSAKLLYQNDFSFANDLEKIKKMVETICFMWTIQLISAFTFCYFLSSKNTETKKYIFHTSALLHVGALFMIIAISVLISSTEYTIPSFLNDTQFEKCQRIIHQAQQLGKITSLASILDFILILFAIMVAFSQECVIFYY